MIYRWEAAKRDWILLQPVVTRMPAYISQGLGVTEGSLWHPRFQLPGGTVKTTARIFELCGNNNWIDHYLCTLFTHFHKSLNAVRVSKLYSLLQRASLLCGLISEIEQNLKPKQTHLKEFNNLSFLNCSLLALCFIVNYFLLTTGLLLLNSLCFVESSSVISNLATRGQTYTTDLKVIHVQFQIS